MKLAMLLIAAISAGLAAAMEFGKLFDLHHAATAGHSASSAWIAPFVVAIMVARRRRNAGGGKNG